MDKFSVQFLFIQGKLNRFYATIIEVVGIAMTLFITINFFLDRVVAAVIAYTLEEPIYV